MRKTDDSAYPASWYAATRDQAPERPVLSGTREVDVAVVGGGFAGLHVARLLARTGRRVAVLERRCVGWGASGRNGGFVGAGFAERSAAIVAKVGRDHARALYTQSMRGRAVVRAVIEEANRPGLLMGEGRLVVARTDQGAGFADATRAMADTLGATFEPWTTEQVQAVATTDRYFQAVHDAQSFQIHALNLALFLAAETERHGGQVFEASEGRALVREGTRWRLSTALGEIRAPHVVLAGSADLGPVHRRLAAAVLPVATYVAVTAKLGPKIAEAVRWAGSISDTRRAGDYYRVIDGDRFLWGGRITTDTSEPARLREWMRGDILSVYPQLSDAPIEWAWPGTMGYAPHRMPQVGEIEPGLWISSAFGGSGLGPTAAAADAIAAGITGEDDRWKLFAPWGTPWAGGFVGRAATQLVYWKMQLADRIDEARQAKNALALRA